MEHEEDSNPGLFKYFPTRTLFFYIENRVRTYIFRLLVIIFQQNLPIYETSYGRLHNQVSYVGLIELSNVKAWLKPLQLRKKILVVP